jgi:hypothetical protein
VDQPKQQGFDMSKLGMGDKLVLGGAALYFIWVFVPGWYKFSLFANILGTSFGRSLTINGFRGFLIISWLLSIVAIGEIVAVKMMGALPGLPAPRGVVHLGVAGGALLFTVLGLLAKPTGFSLSWGIFVALVFAIIWTWGAFQIYSAGPSAAPTPPASGPDTMS